MGSGKTVNILGVLATLAAEDDVGVTTVTSMSMPHLKGGALRDFEMYVYPEFKGDIKKYHRTDHLFTFKGGHMIEFKVFETEFSARGGRRKRLFVNEANKYDYMTYWQLDYRSEQTVIDYNPTIRFWAHDYLENDPETKTFISDHRHNPFLQERKHREIEEICIFDFEKDEFGNYKVGNDGAKIVKRKENGDPVVLKGSYEQWKVYARGVTGNVTGIIFPDWECIDDSDFPEHKTQEWVWSVDFGYTNDPTAMVKICRVGNKLFIKELAYEPGISPLQIKKILQANGFEEGEHLWCEHDPDMIRLLRNIGVSAYPARKGAGSVNAGIQLLNSYEVKYPHTSRNLHKERGLYIWEEDDKIIVDGKPKQMNEPVDLNNHLMDACRYGVYTKLLRANL